MGLGFPVGLGGFDASSVLGLTDLEFLGCCFRGVGLGLSYFLGLAFPCGVGII